MIEDGIPANGVEIAAQSDTGVVRDENQDSYLVETPVARDLLRARGHLIAIADGMGGLRGGQAASRLAIRTLEQSYFTATGDANTALVRAVEDANRAVHELSTRDGGGPPMGSTLTALALFADSASIAHVGDSRAYRFRDGVLRQITRDHSLANELREHGAQPDDVFVTLHKNVLTRGIGLAEEVEVDLFELDDVVAGDVFLLSSDGLHDVVGDTLLAAELAKGRDDLDALLQALVAAARERGGPDNITAVALRVAADAEEAAAPLRLEGAGEPIEGGERRSSWLLAALIVTFILGVIATRLFDGDEMTPERARARIDEILADPDHETSPALQAELERLRALLEPLRDD